MEPVDIEQVHNFSEFYQQLPFDTAVDVLFKGQKKSILRPKLPNPGDEAKFALVIDDLLSPSECEEWIQKGHERGFETALVNVGNGKQLEILDYRHSQRAIIDDFELSKFLYDRVSPFIPEKISGWEKVSLNERLRFLLYHIGDFFAPHYDGVYQRPAGNEKSFITVQLYLNDAPKSGGATNFLQARDEDIKVQIKPKAGRVLLFDHHIYHEGEMVKNGIKYTVRTDVMYRKVAASN